MNDKLAIIEFKAFGLINPTIIQFCPTKDELIRYEITGASVEQICEKIRILEKFFGCNKVKYITAPYILRSIKERSLSNVVKSVWELFNENGINIQENKNGK